MDAADGKQPKGDVQRVELRLLTPSLGFFAGFADFSCGLFQQSKSPSARPRGLVDVRALP